MAVVVQVDPLGVVRVTVEPASASPVIGFPFVGASTVGVVGATISILPVGILVADDSFPATSVSVTSTSQTLGIGLGVTEKFPLPSTTPVPIVAQRLS